MAKAPRPGRAKTRLCPPLQPAQAAALSAAFLRDITENIALAARAAPIHGCVAYAPAGAEAWFAGHLADGYRARAGRRVAADAAATSRASAAACCTLRRRCSRSGIGAVCLVNSDSPTLPTALLARAADALLAPGERIVLGPAEDGGYYLMGMKQPHAHLFADIAWSTSDVAAATRARAAALGIEVVTLPTWYDVDDATSLHRLAAGAAGGAPCGACSHARRLTREASAASG